MDLEEYEGQFIAINLHGSWYYVFYQYIKNGVLHCNGELEKVAVREVAAVRKMTNAQIDALKQKWPKGFA